MAMSHLGSKAESPSDASSGGSGGSESPELGRALRGDTELRTEACGQNLCRSMDGPRVGEIHGHQILTEYQKCPSQVPSVRGVEAGPARTATDWDSSDSNRQCARGTTATHGQGQDSRQSHGQRDGIRRTSVPPDMEGEWAMEPGPYPSSTMTSNSMPTEVHALQQRMLNMENAMMRIMHHLEGQANAVQVPETAFSDHD